MASTGSKVRKTSTKSTETVEVTDVAEVVDTNAVTEVEETPNHVVKEEKKTYRVKKELDPHMYVTVKNGFNGTLVCKGKSGERFVWPEFGDEQDIELMDLKFIKTTYKSFFINNWFLFDDPEIIDYLGVTQFYKHALNSDSFDKLFTKKPDEIKKVVSELSTGQKKSVAFRAKQMISSGDIDSMKVISALEESLGVELVEH